jgi:hypothetical protein
MNARISMLVLSIVCILSLRPSIAQETGKSQEVDNETTRQNALLVEEFLRQSGKELIKLKHTPKESDLFGENPSLMERVLLVDFCSKSLQWDGSSIATLDSSGKSIPTRVEVLLEKLLRQDQTQKSEVEQLRKTRRSEHEQNMMPILEFIEHEAAWASKAQGTRLSSRSIKLLEKPLPTQKDQVKLVEIYQKKELEAEQRFVDGLAVVFDPMQFQILHEKLVKDPYFLYCPLTAKFLNISSDQLERVKADCLYAFKKSNDFDKKRTSMKDLKDDQYPDDVVSDFMDSALYAYRSLTPAQFRQIIPQMQPRWREPGITFQKRLNVLEKSSRNTERFELAILGDLYREGVKWETKSKTKALD